MEIQTNTSTEVALLAVSLFDEYPQKTYKPTPNGEYKEPFGDNYVCPNQKHEDKVYLYAS